MSSKERVNQKLISQTYDEQSKLYTEFSDNRFAWNYLERPAFDKQVSDFYKPETKVLDIGSGTGVVGRHLTSRGVDPHNITNIDISHGQLKSGKIISKDMLFVESSGSTLPFASESFDLVTTNTVLHHCDNDELSKMLDEIHRVLKPDGVYFFVEVDPDHNKDGLNPKNLNKWTNVKTPWGTKVPFFNRDPKDLLDMFDRHGFDKMSGGQISVDPAGKQESANYEYYISHPSRIAARWKKTSETTRILRMNNVLSPNLVETPTQKIQHSLVDNYFRAWNAKTVRLIWQSFSEDAIYNEKPGKKAPIVGRNAIRDYWIENPIAQKNVNINHKIIGFSDKDSIWSEFDGSFDVRREHVEINGIIQFTIDMNTKKIKKLTEYFTTKKTPIA